MVKLQKNKDKGFFSIRNIGMIIVSLAIGIIVGLYFIDADRNVVDTSLQSDLNECEFNFEKCQGDIDDIQRAIQNYNDYYTEQIYIELDNIERDCPDCYNSVDRIDKFITGWEDNNNKVIRDNQQ